MPNQAEEKVVWYHLEPQEVDSWEFEYFNLDTGSWTPVIDFTPVYPCDACFQTFVSVPEFHCCIRARAVNEAGSSEWSEPRPLPEPGISSMLFVVITVALLRGLLRRFIG